MVYRHFPLHPNTPEQGLTLERLFAGKNINIHAAQQRIAKLMHAEGLAYGERKMSYNSRLAQELAVWSAAFSGGWKIHNALFQAYFVDNKNLAQQDVLLQIVSEIGLPVVEAKHVLESRKFQAKVENDWEESRQLGIHSVPTFSFGDEQLVGAQSLPTLRQFLMAYGVASVVA